MRSRARRLRDAERQRGRSPRPSRFEIFAVLLHPAELALPPLGVGMPALGHEPLDVRSDRVEDRVDDLPARVDPVCVAEESDASRLLARVFAVGGEVEPEEEGVAKVFETTAGRRGVEVDDRDREVVAEDEVAR